MSWPRWHSQISGGGIVGIVKPCLNAKAISGLAIGFVLELPPDKSLLCFTKRKRRGMIAAPRKNERIIGGA